MSHHDVRLLVARGVAYFRLDRLHQGRRDFERCLGFVSGREDPSSIRTRAQVLFHPGRLLSALNQAEPAPSLLLESREVDEGRNVEAVAEEEQAENRKLPAELTLRLK